MRLYTDPIALERFIVLTVLTWSVSLPACQAIGSVASVLPCSSPYSCPPGPVVAYFANSDCTGNVQYFPLGEMNTCNNGALMEATESGLAFFNVYSDPLTCDRRISHHGAYYYDVYQWGACLPVLKSPNGPGLDANLEFGAFGKVDRSFLDVGESYLYLPNVNSTFVAPQSFGNQQIQAYVNGNKPCESLDTCTLANGDPAALWDNHYADNRCGGPITSFFNPFEAIDMCLNWNNQTYMAKHCLDQHDAYTAFYADAICSRPIHIAGHRSVCTSAAAKMIQCFALPKPLPPSFIPISGSSASQYPSTAHRTPLSHLYMVASIVLLTIVL